MISLISPGKENMGKFSSSALLCFISLVCVSVVIAKPVRRGPPPPKPVEGNSPESEDVSFFFVFNKLLARAEVEKS